MDRPTCATCAYWHRHQYPEGQTARGDCCRRPPRPQEINGTVLPLYVPTDCHDWCGEHHLFDRYVKFVTTKQDNDAYEARRELMQERAKFVPEVDIKAFMRP